MQVEVMQKTRALSGHLSDMLSEGLGLYGRSRQAERIKTLFPFLNLDSLM